MKKILILPTNYLLLLLSALLLLAGYQLAFKQTLTLWQENRQLRAELNQAASPSIQPGYLERKEANLSGLINRYKTDTIAFRSNILGAISLIAQKQQVRLSEVPVQDPLYRTRNTIIQRLSFEGDFFSLTRTLDDLESTPGIGIVRSASYHIPRIETIAEPQKKLSLEIYLEIAK